MVLGCSVSADAISPVLNQSDSSANSTLPIPMETETSERCEENNAVQVPVENTGSAGQGTIPYIMLYLF